MRTSSLLIGIALLATPLAARAAESVPDPRTARDLAELCAANPREAAGDARINFCHGYAQAVVDAARQQPGEKRGFCIPQPPPRRNQTLADFVSWVRASSDHERLRPAQGLLQFLGERFPCK
jgi:hypothetical protein